MNKIRTKKKKDNLFFKIITFASKTIVNIFSLFMIIANMGAEMVGVMVETPLGAFFTIVGIAGFLIYIFLGPAIMTFWGYISWFLGFFEASAKKSVVKTPSSAVMDVASDGGKSIKNAFKAVFLVAWASLFAGAGLGVKQYQDDLTTGVSRVGEGKQYIEYMKSYNPLNYFKGKK